jgi:hypothetical protein
MTHLRRFRRRGIRRGSAAARVLGVRVRIPLGDMDLSFVSAVSGRGLCVELITCPEIPNECGVPECDREVSIMRRHWPTRGCCAMDEK